MAPDPDEIKFYIVNRPNLKVDPVTWAQKGTSPKDQYNTAGTIAQMSATDLRILRNALWAWHGCKFQSPDLRTYFGKFGWYKPNARVKADPALLTEDERRLFDLVVAEEARRKAPSS